MDMTTWGEWSRRIYKETRWSWSLKHYHLEVWMHDGRQATPRQYRPLIAPDMVIPPSVPSSRNLVGMAAIQVDWKNPVGTYALSVRQSTTLRLHVPKCVLKVYSIILTYFLLVASLLLRLTNNSIISTSLWPFSRFDARIGFTAKNCLRRTHLGRWIIQVYITWVVCTTKCQSKEWISAMCWSWL